MCTWPNEAAAAACGSSALKSAVYGAAELGLDHRHDMREGLRRHLVLQGGEDGERALRQEIGPRTEELPELDHQDAELQRGGAELRQHPDQDLDIGADVALAPRPRPQDAPPLPIDHPDRPQQEPRDFERADHLRHAIDAVPWRTPEPPARCQHIPLIRSTDRFVIVPRCTPAGTQETPAGMHNVTTHDRVARPGIRYQAIFA